MRDHGVPDADANANDVFLSSRETSRPPSGVEVDSSSRVKVGSSTSEDSCPPSLSRPPSSSPFSKAKASGPPNRHDAEGTNKGLGLDDEGLLLNPLHDPLLPFPFPGLHKDKEEEEDEGGGLRRLKHIGACSAPVPGEAGADAALILRLVVGGGEDGS